MQVKVVTQDDPEWYGEPKTSRCGTCHRTLRFTLRITSAEQEAAVEDLGMDTSAWRWRGLANVKKCQEVDTPASGN